MKRFHLKRILTMMLAVFLAAASLSHIALASEGDEPTYERTDSYVINYAKTDLGEYEAQAPYFYASPHFGRMGIRNLDTGEMEWWITSEQVYNLINTTKLAEGGTGAYASIEAYCTDACISAESGYIYQRTNLEDCTFYDDTTAGRIRAIFLNSFPYLKDMAAIEASINAWLAESGEQYTPVSALTGAEAITATQIAIWTVANGEDVKLGSPYYYSDPYTEEELTGEVVYIRDAYVDSTEDSRETTDNNIQMLYNYLTDLSPVAPVEKAISGASFLSTDMVAAKDGEGYQISVTANVDAVVNDGDTLTLTAILGDQIHTTALTDGEKNYTFVFDNVTDPQPVTLGINGYQTVADVFLFDASGDRSASQSMVAYDDSRLPVHAEATVEPDRILNFYKTTLIQTPGAEGEDPITERIPLENIEFELYYLCSLDEYIANPDNYPEIPTKDLIASQEPIVTVRTDALGIATYNLTENGHPDGLYLVIEKENPAIVSPAAPFYVAVPMTNNSGDSWTYTINIEPKNNVVSGPLISKDVTEIDNNEDTFDIDQLHTWIIRGGVPVDFSNAADADMAEKMEYIITDTLDYRLTYKGNMVVRLGLGTDKAGLEDVTLTADEHYVLTATKAQDSENHEVDHFTVSLTAAGMQYIAEAIGAGNNTDYEIRVYFDATINTNADLAVDIPNRATLDYTNSVGFHFDAESDVPVVYTGGMNILKFDAKNAEVFLQGAVFKAARLATPSEIDAGLSQTLTVDGEKLSVVFVEFYTDAALTAKAGTVTTDADGKALLYGLAYGDYYLVEVKAPDGYNLLTGPVKVTVDETSHLETSAIRIANSNEFRLPDTGDVGIYGFMIAGTLFLLAGSILLTLFILRKRAYTTK